MRWESLLLQVCTKEPNSTIIVGFLFGREVEILKFMGYKVTPITNSYNSVT